EIKRQNDDDREQPLHDYPRHREVVGQRVTGFAAFLALVVGMLLTLLDGRQDALFRRPETTQEREYRYGDDRENGDLPQGVECAEIHQNDIDDVGAATTRVGILEEIARNSVTDRLGHHGEGKERHAQPDDQR